ncbi:MAG: flagellar hook-basal body complex protein, partial [Sphingomonadales bacterium]
GGRIGGGGIARHDRAVGGNRDAEAGRHGDGCPAFAQHRQPLAVLDHARGRDLEIAAAGVDLPLPVRRLEGEQRLAFQCHVERIAGRHHAGRAHVGAAHIAARGGAGSALANVTIDNRGIVSAAYADGSSTPVGQIALATFAATGGLRSIGQTKWQASGDSGPPIFGNPGIGNKGEMISGALERSNVDLAEEMVSLLTAQRNFQANARAIDTATQISTTVINLRQQ